MCGSDVRRQHSPAERVPLGRNVFTVAFRRPEILARQRSRRPRSLTRKQSETLLCREPLRDLMGCDLGRSDTTMRLYAAELPALKNTFKNQLGSSANAADEFVARISANEVIARTYLTFGWRYKQRLVRNSCAMELKDAVFKQSMPRFVWVTEFGTRASFDTLDEGEVKVFAHSVVDATSNMLWEGRCVFHAPGFVWRWYQDPTAPLGDHINSMIPIPNDPPYKMKIRGH